MPTERIQSFPYPSGLKDTTGIVDYLQRLYRALADREQHLAKDFHDSIRSAKVTDLSDFPALISGRFLTNDGTTLSWGLPAGSGWWVSSYPGIGEYRVKYIRLDSSKNVVVVYDAVAEVGAAAPTHVESNPGVGEYVVKNMYMDSGLGVVIVYDETAIVTPWIASRIDSIPGLGEYTLKYIRLDSSKNIAFVYDETPIS